MPIDEFIIKIYLMVDDYYKKIYNTPQKLDQKIVVNKIE